MSAFFFFVQLLNAVQFGLVLYLVASGLTLLLGIMGVINLAHGAFYMVGAYMAFAVVQHLASFWLALPLAILLGLALGALLERFLLSRLEGADHLSQVLLSFGLILIINEGQRIIFGNDPHGIEVPQALNFSIPLSETFAYPAYRLFVCAIGIALAINAKRMYLGVTAAGIACAVLAGVIAAPIASVYPGMGDQVLILSFVVIVLGGIGSLNGALVGALLLGAVDAFGKQFFPDFAAFLVYVAMIAVLIVRPQGL